MTAMRVHLWQRSFLLQIDSLSIGRQSKHQKRLSASLFIAHRQPFRVAVNNEPALECQVAILGPGAVRCSLQACDSDLTLLDVGLATPAYRTLVKSIPLNGLRQIVGAEADALLALVGSDFARTKNCQSAEELARTAIALLCHNDTAMVTWDTRVERALAIIDHLPFDAISAHLLATQAYASESHLRDLFRNELGCSPSQYIRWVNMWKVIMYWQAGQSLTCAASEVGFHDLAHFYHVFTDSIGLSPSAISHKKITMTNCQRPLLDQTPNAALMPKPGEFCRLASAF